MNNKLRYIRLDRGMSVSELARRTGVSRATITNIEKGVCNPLATTMCKISDSLDKKVSDIFFTTSVIQELQGGIQYEKQKPTSGRF